MASFFHLAVSLLFASSVIKGYDFNVCLRRIKLDISWVDSYYGVHPYAEVWVNSGSVLTTTYQPTQEVVYGDNEYCKQVNEGDVYNVKLWESNTLADDMICSGAITINLASDLGIKYYYCTDSNGAQNYFDVYTSIIGCSVTYPHYIGDDECDGSVYNTLECYWDGGDCCTATNAALSSNNDCLDPVYSTPVETPTSAPTTPAPTPAPINPTPAPIDPNLCEFILDNVSGFDFSMIGNGICETEDGAKFYQYSYNGYGGSTSINDATCNWDGGDCCKQTNSALSSDNNCMNPSYTTTPTPTTSATSPPTTSIASSSYTGCVSRIEIDDMCIHDGYYATITINGDLVLTVGGDSCSYGADENCEVLAIGDQIKITGYYDDDVQICYAMETVVELSVGPVTYFFYCTDGDGYAHEMKMSMDIDYTRANHAKAKKLAVTAFVVAIVAILTQ